MILMTRNLLAKFANLRNFIRQICESSQLKQNPRNEEALQERRGELKNLRGRNREEIISCEKCQGLSCGM